MDGFCLSFTVTKPLVDGLWFVSREDGYAIKGKNIPCTMEKSDVGIWLFAWLQYRHLRKCFFMKRLALNCMSCSCWKVPTHSYIKKKPVLLQIYNLIYISSVWLRQFSSYSISDYWPNDLFAAKLLYNSKLKLPKLSCTGIF